MGVYGRDMERSELQRYRRQRPCWRAPAWNSPRRHDLRRVRCAHRESAQPRTRRRRRPSISRPRSATVQFDPGAGRYRTAARRGRARWLSGNRPQRPDRDARRQRRARRLRIARCSANSLIAVVLTLPLLAQMVPMLARGGSSAPCRTATGCRAGCSSRSQRRCSSGSAGASTSARGTRCAAAAPTWTC